MSRVDELIDRMCGAAESVPCTPTEFLSAAFLIAQRSIAMIVRESPDAKARMANQETAFRAIETLRFAAANEHDASQIH